MVGGYVVRELVRAGHEVVIFDRFAPPASEKARWVKGDAQDLGEMVSAFAGAQAIVHLAAFAKPGEVPDHILFQNNVMVTYNVHEAARGQAIRRVVSISSIAVTGWPYCEREMVPRYLPIDENHPTAPQDAYGLSKLCGERIAHSYSLRSDMETIVLRLAGVPTLERMARWQEQGGRESRRSDLCSYVDPRDAAVACRLAVELPDLNHEVLFITADDSTSSEPLCDFLPKIMPAWREVARDLTGKQSGVSNLKAKKVLDWRPYYSWRVPS